jgi:tetratricopeptide (TPR) repeat protein
MMQRLQTEYTLKGIFLGLLLFVAWHLSSWSSFGLVAALMLGVFVLCLAIGAYQKSRAGFHLKGRLFAFLLFLILESPGLVYAGCLLGLAAAAIWIRQIEAATAGISNPASLDSWLLTAVLGGAVTGLVFWMLRYLRQRSVRLGLGLLVAAVLVAGVLLGFGKLGEFGERFQWQIGADPELFGAQLLLGIPFFYLLNFAGREEETEIEAGALCAALGLGVGLLTPHQPTAKSLSCLLPLLLYFWYTTRVLPKLRVFKHAIRGFGYAQANQPREAILSFRRALQFDPQNALAREGLWSVHRALNLEQLADDPQTLAVVDLDLCLERAGSLLLQPPSPDKLEEARRLLGLVERQRPDRKAAVLYWRAVAFTHARQYDQAASELQQVLDPAGYAANDAQRRAVLLPAWQLALRSRPELAQRAGQPQLALAGRRMEAIAAVERHLAENPEDAEIWGFKRVLYQDLTEADYNSAPNGESPGRAAADFDHGYVHQLGLALIADSARWQRGCEYLRLAARGLPAQAPSIFTQIAQAHQRHGDGSGAWQNYEQAKRAGRAVGPKNLGEDDRQAYFAAVKVLADAALAHNRLDLAIENYHLYTEYARSGLETLRVLIDLYERNGDPLSALRVTEQALLYSSTDKELLQRKDKYYYSVMPDDLRARLDTARNGFDVAYCIRKARALLDSKNWDLDTLDWAQHLAELVRVVEPDNLTAKVLVGRALLRRGEREEAVALLEQVRTPRPEKFATGEDQDSWYLACKLLGELYLNELSRPELAVECLRSFRESSKSGADTLYKLGQAYEQLGDHPRAVKYYKHVVSYDSHPLAPDARDALYRLQAK